VDDLQTLSLAEAGQLPLHPATCSIPDLLNDAAASFSSQAAAQGVELQVDLPEKQDDLEITADPDRLAQVLANLVSNALRYTPTGGKITLSARPIDGGVRLQVSDTGAGIPPEDLPYIFDRFWRADRSRHRTAGTGSGLGLAIARQIVRAHGGSIVAQSSPGQGTTFILDLPSHLKPT
jgi:two-component system sensor histidine kinase BaeS